MERDRDRDRATCLHGGLKTAVLVPLGEAAEPPASLEISAGSQDVVACSVWSLCGASSLSFITKDRKCGCEEVSSGPASPSPTRERYRAWVSVSIK